MGLVNRVLPDTELDQYLADYLHRISENAPLTIAAVKQVTLAIEQNERILANLTISSPPL